MPDLSALARRQVPDQLSNQGALVAARLGESEYNAGLLGGVKLAVIDERVFGRILE